jgi:hypothetical protein
MQGWLPPVFVQASIETCITGSKWGQRLQRRPPFSYQIEVYKSPKLNPEPLDAPKRVRRRDSVLDLVTIQAYTQGT